jgi:hypothetical protein
LFGIEDARGKINGDRMLRELLHLNIATRGANQFATAGAS